MKIYNVPDAIQRAAQAQAPGLGKNPVARSGAPLVLYSELTSISAGNGAVFPVMDLVPSYATAYWIDEIRITVGARENLSTSPLISNTALPAALRLQFSTGQHEVSKVAVPTMMFSQVYGRDEYDNTQQLGGNDGLEYRNFRWVLAKPLYMPVGDVLQCRAERDGTLASQIQLQNLTLTYLGRACAPGEAPPAVRHVPYVGYYKHPEDELYSSVADEFKNPFLKPLTIQRFVVRVVDYEDDPDDATKQHLVGPADAGSQEVFMSRGVLPNSNNVPYTEMKMLDSNGYMIVPEMTPIGMVVDAERCAWTFNRQLGPREKIDVAFNTVLQVTPQEEFYDIFLSMVGYREEAV